MIDRMYVGVIYGDPPGGDDSHRTTTWHQDSFLLFVGDEVPFGNMGPLAKYRITCRGSSAGVILTYFANVWLGHQPLEERVELVEWGKSRCSDCEPYITFFCHVFENEVRKWLDETGAFYEEYDGPPRSQTSVFH